MIKNKNSNERKNRFWNCFHNQYGEMIWWGSDYEK